MATIGFIGLGSIGSAMAGNLLRADHHVKVYDLDAAKIDALVEKGGEACRSATSAADSVEILMSVLPNTKTVEGLYIDEEALLDFVDPATRVVDCSAITVDAALRIHATASARNIAVLDAPALGIANDAAACQLNLPCGGEEADFEALLPVLKRVGSTVMRAGGPGAGQKARICHNMLLAISMIGVSEALQLGVDNGLDAAALSEILLGGPAGNRLLEHHNPVPGIHLDAPASRAYEDGSSVASLNRDLAHALALSAASQTAVPAGSVSAALYRMHENAGNGELDISSILNLLTGLQS